MEEVALARALVDLRPEPAPSEGPLVSIVVTNRDGEEHLGRLLDGLEHRTHYRPIELVLVDNGSTDGSLALVEAWPGPKQVLANAENQSFSAANNQGIRAANGELVLLANNDIDPIHPDWLGYLVSSLTPDVAAAGALLIYPRRPVVEGAPPAHPDHTVQHRGISFLRCHEGVRATNTGAGGDPLQITNPAVRPVPGVTAACLLARRSDLRRNLLDEGYWYGTEDWDLNLRLGNVGQVVVDERAVLFHHEYGTQDRYRDDAWLERRRDNRRRFNDLWGPSVLRRLRLEAIDDPEAWFFRGTSPPTAYLTQARGKLERRIGRHLSRQLVEAGWEVLDRKPGQCDLAVSLSPPSDPHWLAGQDLSVAIVVDDEKEWAASGGLDAAHTVLTPERVTAARVDALWAPGLTTVAEPLRKPAAATSLLEDVLDLARPAAGVMRIGVATCAPDWERAQFWGDTHLARGLMRAFRRLGHEATELVEEDWQSRRAASCDFVVHLRGLKRRPLARGQWNLLWIISHPDRLEPGECEEYDIVATASLQHAQQLTEELGRPVHYLPQATDADTFRAGAPSPDYEAPVLYVGNARYPARRAPRWLLRNGTAFHLYGMNWDGLPEATHLHGDYIPNHQLATAYRSASVVVADHHGSMRANGFVANRLFDVLASGGLVLSDEMPGLTELFGDVIPTYADERQLDERLAELLGDAALRRRIITAGRAVVLAQHTLDHRAQRILEILDAL